MIAAGLVELFLGVDAAQRSLEDIATPLTAEEADEERRPRPTTQDAGHASRPPRAPGSRLRHYH